MSTIRLRTWRRVISLGLGSDAFMGERKSWSSDALLFFRISFSRLEQHAHNKHTQITHLHTHTHSSVKK